MSDSPALKNPRVHVIMADGAEWDAQTQNPDLMRYERTAGKNGWLGLMVPSGTAACLAGVAAIFGAGGIAADAGISNPRCDRKRQMARPHRRFSRLDV